MSTQSKPFSFKGQKIFVGLDVHLRSWSVTVLSEQAVLKKFTQDPSPAALNKFLTNTYPDAEYYSVYEAGFCGPVKGCGKRMLSIVGSWRGVCALES